MKQQPQILRKTEGARHRGPGIPPGAMARRGSFQMLLGMAVGLLSAACSQSAPTPLLSQQTTRGEIQYTLHSSASPGKGRAILAHGFLRKPETMEHIAASLAKEGIETACIALRRSWPWAGNHDANALDMIALRKALGWESVTYAGFSAGGLSALIAASKDPACAKLVLLDPVDHKELGLEAAPKASVPTLALLGKPGPGNANRNAAAMLAEIPRCRITEVPEAGHCDFEARPSALCHILTGSKADAARTASVHETIISESSRFLKNQTANIP